MSSNVFLSYLKLNFIVYLDLFLQEKAFSQNRKKIFFLKNPDIKISQISYFFSRGYPEILNPGIEIYDKKQPHNRGSDSKKCKVISELQSLKEPGDHFCGRNPRKG